VHFVVSQLLEYKGQYIAYGTSSQHGILVASGLKDIPERPGCFAWLPHERREVSVTLSRELNSRPLALLEDISEVSLMVGRTAAPKEVRAFPILTVGYPSAFAKGPAKTHDEFVKRATQAVDLYLEWKRLDGKFPSWYYSLKATNSSSLS